MRHNPTQLNLAALHISNGAAFGSDKPLPTRLKLLNWGDNKTIKGVVKVGPATAAILSANQKSQGYDRVALDFEHQTVPGSEQYQKDPVVVAAYGTPSVVPNDGLYLENIQWTPKGQEFARNYSDLSPTVLLDKEGQVTFLHSAALTRHGAVEGLTFYSVTLKSFNSMDPAPTPNAAPAADPNTNYRALLCTLLQKLGVNIPDQASDSDVATMVDQFAAPPKPGAPGAAPAKPADAKPGDDPAKMQPMSAADIAKIVRQEMSSASADSDRSALVALAAQQGKVIPLDDATLKTLTVPALRQMVDKLPITVPMQSRSGAPNPPPGSLLTLSQSEKDICGNLGISPEQYRKYDYLDRPAGALI